MLSVLALFFFSLYRSSRRSKRKLEEKNKIIEQTNQELIELDDFKDSLLKSIYHDLRFPVSVITDLSKQSLQAGFQGDHVTQSNLNEIRSIASYLNTLSETVLTIERIKKKNYQIALSDHSLSEAVNEALRQLQSVQKSGNIIFSNSISQSAHAKFDFNNLVRVFVNLASNSSKAIQEKQKYQNSFEGRITFSTKEENGGRIRIEISDNGIGMNKILAQKLLNDEPLHGNGRKKQPVNEIEPTGLGFSFCKKIIELHNSDLEITTKRRAGTTISFTLKGVENSDIKLIDEEEKDINLGLYLKEEDKIWLSQYLQNVKEIPFFKFSELENVINRATKEKQSEGILKWQEKAKNALYKQNSIQFRELVQIDKV